MLARGKTPAAKLAADLAADAGRARTKLRGLSHRLLPAVLEEGLLAVALGQLVAAANGGPRGVCTFRCAHPEPVFASRVATHLYRIAQEAISNALRHSGGRNIRIALQRENGQTVLRIDDDGKGLSPEAAHAGGMGLRTMQYRAALLGGKLEAGPGPDGGTRIECRVGV
jgi:signal transduction histidine kinase